MSRKFTPPSYTIRHKNTTNRNLLTCVLPLPLVSGTGDPFSLSLRCPIVDEGLEANSLPRFSMSCRICLITDLKLLFCASSSLIFSSGGKSRGFPTSREESSSCSSLFGSCVGMARPCLWRVAKAWSLVWVKTRISSSLCANSRSRSWASAAACWYRNKTVYHVEGLLFGYWKEFWFQLISLLRA